MPLVWSTACSALVLVLVAACGGDEPRATTAAPAAPALGASVGGDLASRSDRVAVLLAGNDVEGARAAASELRDRAVAAIDAGRVPAELQGELLSGVNRLLAAIPAPEPAPDEPAADEEEKDADKDEVDDEDEAAETGDGPGKSDESNGKGNGGNGNGSDG